MRYIDWIAFAYRLRCLNSYILVHSDMMFELDMDGNPITADTTFKSLLMDFKLLLDANIEKAPTLAINKEMYFNLLSELGVL